MTNPKVTVVFAAKTPQEAVNQTTKLQGQKYAGEVEIIGSTKGTIPEALNDAISKATGELILFTETDVDYLNDHWVADMVAAAQRGKFVKGLESNHLNRNWCSTIIYREDMHGETIDESFPVAEDTEYFLRMEKKHGIKFDYAWNVNVMHRKDVAAISEKALERAYEYGVLTARLLDEYKWHPYEAYKNKQALTEAIGRETMRGIKDYENGKS